MSNKDAGPSLTLSMSGMSLRRAYASAAADTQPAGSKQGNLPAERSRGRKGGGRDGRMSPRRPVPHPGQEHVGGAVREIALHDKKGSKRDGTGGRTGGGVGGHGDLSYAKLAALRSH